MSSLGRITNSFFSGTNDNTLALANLNVDFALVKFEAPKEFTGLGTALSTTRRKNAEDGPLHKTLRKLGCLFEQILPSTPKLIEAYGLRTSEIIQTPGISPNGSRSHGPFEQFVGADGASIWAAATSGPAALSVNLLACMLARQFDDSKICVAILVELVAERQREILEQTKNNHIVSMPSMMAAQQDITREELAAFDASARSWLSSADEAKISCQKKLMLMLRNVNTTIGGGSSTYVKVLEAWTQAMVGFEDLLKGVPQQVSSGAVLRALSAWHLYPDLIVLAEKTINVKFADPLLPRQGVVTIGLQLKGKEPDKGIQWSLTLSHLRFYGDPVTVQADGNDSRVNMRELHMIAFGSLLGIWNVSADGVEDAALWFQAIWIILQNAEPEEVITSSLPWFRILVETANEFLDSQGDDRETSRLLVNYGRRRGKLFLTKPSEKFAPFFGLDHPHMRAYVECNTEYGTQHFREVAKTLNLEDHEAYIMYLENCEDGEYCEIATAVPHSRRSSKRGADGSARMENIHARWIVSEYSFSPESNLACSCQTTCTHNCPCRDAGLFCNQSCHQYGQRSCQAHWLASRFHGPRESNEEIILIKKKPFQDSSSSREGKIRWPDSPVLYGSETESRCSIKVDSEPLSNSCCRCFEPCDESFQPKFVPIWDFEEGFSLCIKDSHNQSNCLSSQVKEHKTPQISVCEMLQYLSSAKVKPRRLLKFLEKISPRALVETHGMKRPSLSTVYDNGPGCYRLSSLGHVLSRVQQSFNMPASFIRSLGALSIASRLYDGMVTTSVPLKLVEQPLYGYEWIHNDALTPHAASIRLSRAEAMACILTFESGGMCASPNEMKPIMAISSRNSIFIAGVLLSDPSEVARGSDIRRVAGNVGRPGITLLVSPSNLLIKPPSQNYRAATHAEYDGGRLDCFSATSLHLTFTKWTLPLNGEDYGFIDQDVFLAEAIISVRDCGRWIADIHALAARTENCAATRECIYNHPETSFTNTFTSIDSWEELLDPPLGPGIFRAHGNWAARLAALCILKQKNLFNNVIIVDQERSCPRCVEDRLGLDANTVAVVID